MLYPTNVVTHKVSEQGFLVFASSYLYTDLGAIRLLSLPSVMKAARKIIMGKFVFSLGGHYDGR